MAERTYTIPLKATRTLPVTRRAATSIRIIKDYVARHTKEDEIAIDEAVNERLWARGMARPPRAITVKVEDDPEGEGLLVSLSE